MNVADHAANPWSGFCEVQLFLPSVVQRELTQDNVHWLLHHLLQSFYFFFQTWFSPYDRQSAVREGCAAVVRISVVLMLTWFGFDTVALHFTAEAWCLFSPNSTGDENTSGLFYMDNLRNGLTGLESKRSSELRFNTQWQVLWRTGLQIRCRPLFFFRYLGSLMVLKTVSSRCVCCCLQAAKEIGACIHDNDSHSYVWTNQSL